MCVCVGQAYVALVALSGFLALQVYARPYKLQGLNALDIASQAVTWLSLAFAILYWHWSDTEGVSEAQEAFPVVVILAANFGMLLVFIFAVVRSANEN